MAARLIAVGQHFGLAVTCLQTDGSQPVGRGIGPALEAHDVLAVLQNSPAAPMDLRDRAAALSGAALEIGGVASAGGGLALALATLESGAAWEKFRRICIAQGGMRTPASRPKFWPFARSEMEWSDPLTIEICRELPSLRVHLDQPSPVFP